MRISLLALVHRTSIAALMVTPALTAACTEEVVDPLPRVTTLETSGGYALDVDATGSTLSLRRGDAVLTTLDAASFALGVVDEVRDDANYDPYPVLAATPGFNPPTGLVFHEGTAFLDVATTEDGVDVTVQHGGGFTSRVSIRATVEGTFRLELVPTDPARVAYLRVGAIASEGEAFYGLGEYFDDVNHRGKLRAMQLEIADLESANNEAHVPVPFVIGTKGWGLFVQSSYPGAFDVALRDGDRVDATFGTGAAAKDGLALYLFAAEHPLDVTRRYYEVTGYPRLPAPWALGPLVWRDENDDQAQVVQDVTTMRDLDLAASGIWIDRPYATDVNTFDFDPVKFPDPQLMIQRAQGLGFRVAVWHVPYLDDESAATEALRAEAERAGYYPIETGVTLNGWGDPFDFTVPEAVSWWQGKLADYIALGIEGFKLDYGEDIVPSLLGARNVYVFHDGSDERTMHRGYTLLYHDTYADLLPEEGGLLLCRAGKWGDQVSGPVIWPGDLDARLWRHGEEVTEDGETFRAVGGLHASMIAGLTLGPSGFPFYGADTGGYRHSPPDAETFRRWFEQTAFSSVMQIGTSSSDVAWEFGDAELLDSYREYTRLHLRLFPYEWTIAKELGETGRPIQRPFGLQEPELGEHPSDQYFFGEDLLVAPVTEAGVDARDVQIPSGSWVGFWTGSSVDGPRRVTSPAPLGRIPVFLRRGALVPMLRPTIDTLAPVDDPDRVDSFATRAGHLWVLLAPGGSTERELYDGTVLVQSEAQNEITLRVLPGAVFDEGTVFEIITFGEQPPARVVVNGVTLDRVSSAAELDGRAQGFTFAPDDRDGTLLVKLGPGSVGRDVSIER